MEFALQALVGLLCLPLTALELRSLFAPAAQAVDMGIAPQGAQGLNTVRGVIGGFFLACVAMLATGLVTGATEWFLAVAFLMAAVIAGRVVGLVADGLDKAVLPPIAVETVIATVMIGAYLGLATPIG